MRRELRQQGITRDATYRTLWLGSLAKYWCWGSSRLVLYPLLLIISTSLKDPLDVTANPFTLFSSFGPINFYDAWTLGGFGGYSGTRW